MCKLYMQEGSGDIKNILHVLLQILKYDSNKHWKQCRQNQNFLRQIYSYLLDKDLKLPEMKMECAFQHPMEVPSL